MSKHSAFFQTVQGYRTITTARRLPEGGGVFVGTFSGANRWYFDEQLKWHHSNTARLSALVAVGVGLPYAQMREVFQAALVHDVGKFLVPETVVAKAEKLDAHELRVMQGHAAGGAELLLRNGFCEATVRAVRHHHERWDGTGYPDGLNGEQIPRGARVIAVCDALDAMEAGRHYMARLRPKEIIEEIRAESGRQFDPLMAAVVLDFLRRKGEVVRVQNRA